MLVLMGILFGGIILWKLFTKFMMYRYLASQSMTVTVSTMQVKALPWQPKLKATASLRAINGVDVTTSLAGSVKAIYFVPGSMVKAGTLLVQLNADAEIGALQSLQAQEKLAQITYDRDKAQYAVHAVSKQIVDTDFQNIQNLQGQVAQQQAIVNKKTIRAPFDGRLGICNVNLGQYINPGDKIVSLQMLHPIYADFYLPQQALAKLKLAQIVNASTDTYPNKNYVGRITTINPAIDTSTRNVLVEATLDNLQYELTPGMFAHVEVDVGTLEPFLTVPQTAISFNPYGSVVYVVNKKGKDKNGKPILIATQTFVKTGETRGDQIAILSGIKANDTIVTSGQLKLKSGAQVEINNSILPANSEAPQVSNDH